MCGWELCCLHPACLSLLYFFPSSHNMFFFFPPHHWEMSRPPSPSLQINQIHYATGWEGRDWVRRLRERWTRMLPGAARRRVVRLHNWKAVICDLNKREHVRVKRWNRCSDCVERFWERPSAASAAYGMRACVQTTMRRADSDEQEDDGEPLVKRTNKQTKKPATSAAVFLESAAATMNRNRKCCAKQNWARYVTLCRNPWTVHNEVLPFSSKTYLQVFSYFIYFFFIIKCHCLCTLKDCLSLQTQSQSALLWVLNIVFFPKKF